MNPENFPMPFLPGLMPTPFEKQMMFYSFCQMQKFPYFNYPGYFPMAQFPPMGLRPDQIRSVLPGTEDQVKREVQPISTEALAKRVVREEDVVEEKERVNETVGKPNCSLEKNEGIQMILRYFIQNIGRVRSNRINLEREKFNSNPELTQIFDLLMKKYIMSNKTKEEKIKYILRKSFKYLGSKLKREQLFAKNLRSKKEFDRIFNDFYMSDRQCLASEDQSEPKADEKPKCKLIFTKESFNKTMNSSFLNTIFSKEGFVQDYREFLEHFHQMSLQDNEDKLVKAVKKLGKLKNLHKCTELSHRFFKRMPWLEVWIEEAEMIAKKLPEKSSTLLLKDPLMKQLGKKKQRDQDESDLEDSLEISKSLKRKRANSF